LTFYSICGSLAVRRTYRPLTIGCLRAPKTHSARGRSTILAEAGKECVMSYVTLEAFLKKEEEDLFWDLLRELSAEDRIVKLKTLLLDAASKHIDKKASFLWEALLRAFSDQTLAPLMSEVEEHGRKEIQVRSARPIDSEATEIHQAHRQQRAALAQEIYAAIPAFREELVWDDTQRKKQPVKRLTLLETKKLLWHRIAGQWRDASDCDEAIALLDWLLALDTPFVEERDALGEIIRARSGSMNGQRLLDSMLRIKQYYDNRNVLGEGEDRKIMRCRHIDDWLSSILHAWIRQQKIRDAVDQVTALAPVSSRGRMAWDILRQMVQPLGEFCLQAHLLQEFIRPENAWRSIFDAGTVVRYEKLGEAIVEIDANNDAFMRDQTGADVVLAAKAKEQLGDWAKRHPGVRILVRIGHQSTISASPGFKARMEFWIN